MLSFAQTRSFGYSAVCLRNFQRFAKKVLTREEAEAAGSRDVQKRGVDRPTEGPPKIYCPKWIRHGNPQDKDSRITQSNDGRPDRSERHSFQYQELPEKDYDFIQLMIKLKTRRQREKSGLILLEGRRLIFDALMSGVVTIKSIYFSDPENIRKLPLVPNECKIFRVTEGRLAAWSDLTTSPDLIAIAQEPNYEALLEAQQKAGFVGKIPLTVICDNIRDPGNMGSILRVIAAAGCDKILAVKGCVDVWERKTLRGAMGAHFRVPILPNITWETATQLIPESTQIYLADSNSFEVTAEAESFKQEPNHMDFESVSPRLSDAESDEDKYSKMKLPVVPYSDVTFTDSDHVTLVIGGETEGISISALKLAHSRGGVKVHIPMGNRMESLNAATAAGILIFEIRRQFLQTISAEERESLI